MKRRLGAFLAIIAIFVVCIPLQNSKAANPSCDKVGVVKKSGSKSYRCALVSKQRRWVVIKNSTEKTASATTTAVPVVTTTTTAVPVSKRISLVRTLPSYDFNSLWFPEINTPGFQYSHWGNPIIGQSFVFDRAMTLESLVFTVLALTTVSDIDVYLRTPEPANHESETFDTQSKVPMRLQLTLSKSRLATPLLDDIEMTRDVVQLYTQTFDKVIGSRQPVELVFDTPLAVEPGSYLVTIRLEALTEYVKRQILTVWVVGHHSGNASRGRYDRRAENNCTYTPGTDFYPNGRAYKGGYVGPYVDWQSAPSRTLETLLTEHRTKVQECIRIGNYADIFNDGDLIMEWRGTWR